MKPYATRDTPMKPSRNTNGTASPTWEISPCPFPDIASVGATSASDIASASQSLSLRFPPTTVLLSRWSCGPGEPGHRVPVGPAVAERAHLVAAHGCHGVVQVGAEDLPDPDAVHEALEGALQRVRQPAECRGLGLGVGQRRRVHRDLRGQGPLVVDA